VEEEWLAPEAALTLIHEAKKRGVDVAGFDAAYLWFNGTTQPSLSDSWAYTIAAWPEVPDRYAHAVAFIGERASLSGIHFSVFLDENDAD